MLRKTLLLTATFFLSFIFTLVSEHRAYARYVGATTATTVTTPDIQCFGGTNKGTSSTATEVCLDWNGSWIPTTDNAQPLGLSTLRYSDVETVKINSGGGALAIGASGSVPSASFVTNLSLSSVTVQIPNTGFTNTTWVCLSTVTLAVPANGGSVAAVFNGSTANTTLDKKVILGVLVDGALVNGEDATHGLSVNRMAVAAKPQNASFEVLITGLSVASHQFCLGAYVDANTGNVDSTDSIAKFAVHLLP